MIKIFKGNILYTKIPEKFSIIEDGYIVVEKNIVVGVYKELPSKYENRKIEVETKGLIIPGFNDIHVHASQWINGGMGFSLELLPWLNKYTFAVEEKYKNSDFAKKSYKISIDEMIKNGTTRASIFATRHLEGTKILIDLLRESGMGAFVGKVNMDRNSIPGLIEDTDASISETLELIEWMNKTKKDDDIVKYIITPRYVPCTTSKLMKELGKLSSKYELPVQSHLDENKDEINWVSKLHPECHDFTSVYNDYGLMPKGKTIMAHCIHSTDEELNMLKEKGVLIAHCPQSNANLSSGIMSLRKYMDLGLRIGLGSDVGGGHTLNMREHIVETIKTSKLYWTLFPEYKPVSFSEAFYLATKGGGSIFGNVGSFEEGYEFDALIIDDSNLINEIPHNLEERLERFIYVGSYKNIYKKYVAGSELM